MARVHTVRIFILPVSDAPRIGLSGNMVRSRLPAQKVIWPLRCTVNYRALEKVTLEKVEKINLFQEGQQKLSKNTFNNHFYVCFNDFEAGDGILFMEKVTKNAPKHELV